MSARTRRFGQCRDTEEGAPASADIAVAAGGSHDTAKLVVARDVSHCSWWARFSLTEAHFAGTGSIEFDREAETDRSGTAPQVPETGVADLALSQIAAPRLDRHRRGGRVTITCAGSIERPFCIRYSRHRSPRPSKGAGAAAPEKRYAHSHGRISFPLCRRRVGRRIGFASPLNALDHEEIIVCQFETLGESRDLDLTGTPRAVFVVVERSRLLVVNETVFLVLR